MTPYAAARHQIETGDVLGVRGRGFSPGVIRAVQRLSGLGDRSSTTHVGIAWWLEGRLYSVEMDGRYNVLRPVSQHIKAGCQVDVYRCPVAPAAVAATYNQAISSPIHYDFLDLITIGLRLLLRLSVKTADGNDQMVCSTYVARWLQWAGWHPDALPGMPSPAEVCAVLGERVMEIEGYE